MSNPDIRIRRLDASDGDAYRALRLEGLKLHPQAFTAAYEIESQHPTDWFVERLTRLEIYGASLGDGPVVGLTGLSVPESPRTRHQGDIWGVYVRDQARRTGLAAALLSAVIEAARPRVEALTLGVGAYNVPAQRLYQAAGFRSTAFLPRVVKVGDVYYDEILMRLDF